MEMPLKPIVMCADDYGLSDGVSTAIETLLAAGRLSATSAMSLLPGWHRRAPHLRAIAAGRADVGLHLTLTDHEALTALPGLARGGRLPPLRELMLRAYTGRIDARGIAAEIHAQLDAFEAAWQAPPDFVDGHQHVHLLPPVREALIAALLRRYPCGTVYVRNCAESPARCVRRGIGVAKALFIATLGAGFARQAARAGLPMNDGFSGIHDFHDGTLFRARMQRFLAVLGPRPLVHVHPAHCDTELAARDTLTAPRAHEFAYLKSEAFAADLDAAGVRLARFSVLASARGF